MARKSFGPHGPCSQLQWLCQCSGKAITLGTNSGHGFVLWPSVCHSLLSTLLQAPCLKWWVLTNVYSSATTMTTETDNKYITANFYWSPFYELPVYIVSHWQPSTWSVPKVLPCQECHILGEIIRYTVFCLASFTICSNISITRILWDRCH